MYCKIRIRNKMWNAERRSCEYKLITHHTYCLAVVKRPQRSGINTVPFLSLLCSFCSPGATFSIPRGYWMMGRGRPRYQYVCRSRHLTRAQIWASNSLSVWSNLHLSIDFFFYKKNQSVNRLILTFKPLWPSKSHSGAERFAICTWTAVTFLFLNIFP